MTKVSRDDIERIRASGLFDAEWYLEQYPDVRALGMDPAEHYLWIGAKLGRDPKPRDKFFIENTQYDSEFQIQEDFTSCTSDIKTIAFYLPQFHNSPHNNKWWGDGFTEWTNTEKSIPRFTGHYQPRRPHKTVGHYDLAEADALRKQVSLARQHGIYGFCIYHYWFSGEQLLSTPTNILLNNPDIDINFCLCWANENWTRQWDGLDSEILIQQSYSERDPEAFIDHLKPYLSDRRYIRVEGKPVIIVYKAHLIPNAADVFSTWRKKWHEISGQDLLIWAARTDRADPSCIGLGGVIDATVEFPPHMFPMQADATYEIDQRSINVSTSGHIFDYRKLVNDIIREPLTARDQAYYRCVMLGWDNAARREVGWSVWYGFSLKEYYAWFRHIIEYSRSMFAEERRFVFINAWNEWAEGTYLEPDEKYGYASLNVTSRAIFGRPLIDLPTVIAAKPRPLIRYKPKIAVHAHIFFEDIASELTRYLNNIPCPYDLFITSDTDKKCQVIRSIFDQFGTQASLDVIQTQNIGRDIGPFLVDVAPRLKSYDLIGHFHSKKSTTVSWGDRWRRYLLNNLLGSQDGVRAILQCFIDEPSLGLLYPPPYPLIAPHCNWGGNKGRAERLLSIFDSHQGLPDHPSFPAGNMFWARSDAIRLMLDYRWNWSQFESENGQLGETLAHCIERIWKYAAVAEGYRTTEILFKFSQPDWPDHDSRRRIAFFVHHNARHEISEADLFLLRQLEEFTDKIVIVSNTPIPPDTLNGLSNSQLIERENSGFDFGAWRDALRRVGKEQLLKYDEIILLNNSCYGPLFPLSELFCEMNSADCDFWGVTAFPEATDSPRPEAKLLKDRRIPPHLQSYFMVFRRSVYQSAAFWEFWDNVQDKVELIDVVASYEVQLTELLTRIGFRFLPYIPEGEVIQEQQILDPSFNAIYNLPIDFLTLRDPFLKKKSWFYAPKEMVDVKALVKSFGFFPSEMMRDLRDHQL